MSWMTAFLGFFAVPKRSAPRHGRGALRITGRTTIIPSEIM
jgi:hypothetical protein